jgi:ABC-type dipeptide/oligopeptide/nickel transport system permease subunit
VELLVETITWTDEFDRSILSTTVFAALLSMLRALAAAILLFVLAFTLILVAEVKASRSIGWLVRLIIDALESVPAFVWIIAAVSALSSGGFVIVTVIFAFAAMPLVFNFLSGVVRNIMHQPYYLAAIALGVGNLGLILRHIIPNAVPLCMPPFFYVVGSAITVYGAIGIFGFINRRSLDLGVFLLRGKEQAALDPLLLIVSLSAYLILFVLLRWLLLSVACTKR